MITDVPTAHDFQQSGIGFLNLAWENAIQFYLDVEEWKIYEDEVELSEEYWTAAQKPLAASLALAQQGIELLLKSQIASVSPYLLITGNSRDWPKGCDKKDTAFADYRTIDAQDLIRVRDAVATNSLTEEFKQKIGTLRRKRNSIFHTVDRRARIQLAEVITAVLDASEAFIGSRKWFGLRKTSLQNDRLSAIWSTDHVAARIARETLVFVNEFPPKLVRQHLGIAPKQRRYLCPNCYHETNGEFIDLAQLTPNRPTSTTVHCFGCNEVTNVVRTPCSNENCKGNVVEQEAYDMCLTCGNSQS